MFKKFFQFLHGYVIIKISGKNFERFINICLKRNIEIWNTNPCDDGITLCMYSKDFKHIRDAAYKCLVKIKILKKHSFVRTLHLYRKRYVFLVAILICIGLGIFFSNHIWVVEINGVENADIQSISNTLDRIGVKTGALKNNLPDGMEIKRNIINDTDGVAWAWVYIEGVKARVEIYEKALAPNVIDKDIPCDIVAACDGVIKKTIVKSGEELFDAGDAVSAGEVIISGKVPVYKEGNPEKYIYVHSMAEVQAYTTHCKTGNYKTYYESRVPTGREKMIISLETFGKLLSPFKDEVSYEEYDTKENRYELKIPFFGFSGIALHVKKYTEVSINKEPLSIETSLEFAKNDLEAKISKELTLGSVFQDESIEYVQTDNETINVKLTMNFIENIAITQPISADTDKGEELFDKQTDRGIAGD